MATISSRFRTHLNTALAGGPALFADGTVSAPSIAFNSDNDGTGTGFYRSAANSIGVALNGSNRWTWGNTGIVTMQANAASVYAFTIENTSGVDSSTSALRVTTNTASAARIISCQNAGTERFAVTGSGDVLFGNNGSLGNVASAGAWTIGPASGTLTHIVQANAVTLRLLGNTSSAVLEIRSATGGSAISFLDTVGAVNSSIGHITAVNLLQFSGGAGVVHGSLNSSGSWTIGSSTVNASHQAYGQLTDTYVATAFNAHVMEFRNFKAGAVNNTALIQFRATTGDATASAWQMGNVAGAGSNLSDFILKGQTAPTTMAEYLRISSVGAFTIGPATGLTTSHIVQAGSISTLTVNRTGSGSGSILFTQAGVSQARIGFDAVAGDTMNGTTINDIVIRNATTAGAGGIAFGGGSGNNTFGRMSFTGGWTFGPTAGGVAHQMYGQDGNPTSFSGSLNIDASAAANQMSIRLGTYQTGDFSWIQAIQATTGNPKPLRFYSATVHAGTYDASGNWTWGTTTTANNHTMRSGGAASSNVVCDFAKPSGPAANSANNLYLNFLANTNVSDGTIQTNGSGVLTIVDAVSDMRLKDNIRDATYGLHTIMALRPVEFDWPNGIKGVKGFIAQEVLPIIPESVMINDHSAKGGLSDHHTMETMTMIPILVKSVQELKNEKDAEIAALRAEIEALKGN